LYSVLKYTFFYKYLLAKISEKIKTFFKKEMKNTFICFLQIKKVGDN
jgi:hypothetical protein